MSRHWFGKRNGDVLWPAAPNREYAMTAPRYDSLGHSHHGIFSPEKYDLIQLGMTLQQVEDIMGGPGLFTSESGEGNVHMVRIAYHGHFWSNKYAVLVFQNGRLLSKSQHQQQQHAPHVPH